MTMVGTKGTMYPIYIRLTFLCVRTSEKRYIKSAMGAISTKLPICPATFESENRVDRAMVLNIIVKPYNSIDMKKMRAPAGENNLSMQKVRVTIRAVNILKIAWVMK